VGRRLALAGKLLYLILFGTGFFSIVVFYPCFLNVCFYSKETRKINSNCSRSASAFLTNHGQLELWNVSFFSLFFFLAYSFSCFFWPFQQQDIKESSWETQDRWIRTVVRAFGATKPWVSNMGNVESIHYLDLWLHNHGVMVGGECQIHACEFWATP
jgi:hypothetical protein